MEALLQLAFDNLSSYNDAKIKRGMKQIEGLLAQLCLPLSGSGAKPNKPSAEPGKKTTDPPPPPPPPPKTLAELSTDPAFREFFRLQEGFSFNITARLLNTMDRLMACGADGKNDMLLLSALDLTQGTLLLHPPSKSLFVEEKSMNLLLDLLEPVNCPAIQCATIKLMVVAMMDCPQNTRTFERLDGLLTITSALKHESTASHVRVKILEFLYFYMMPETPSIPSARASNDAPALLQRSPSKLARAFKGNGNGGSKGGAGEGAAVARKRADSEAGTLPMERKKEHLMKYLPTVDELVRDLKRCDQSMFSGVVA